MNIFWLYTKLNSCCREVWEAKRLACSSGTCETDWKSFCKSESEPRHFLSLKNVSNTAVYNFYAKLSEYLYIARNSRAMRVTAVISCIFFSLVLRKQNLSHPYPDGASVPGALGHPPSSHLQVMVEMKTTWALGAHRKILCLRRYFEDADAVEVGIAVRSINVQLAHSHKRAIFVDKNPLPSVPKGLLQILDIRLFAITRHASPHQVLY